MQRLEPREVFLARALLTSGPSPVALSALSEVSVIAIPAQALLRFLSANPHLARRFEAVIDLTEHGLVVAATAVA